VYILKSLLAVEFTVLNTNELSVGKFVRCRGTGRDWVVSNICTPLTIRMQRLTYLFVCMCERESECGCVCVRV